jgi:S-adenosylmethionine:tRNA ribosyltransferase-isomerase
VLCDHGFADLPSLLAPGDLLVFNDTRVIRARLEGRKDTGGRIEVMVERIVAEREAHALVRASHLPKAGGTIAFDGCQAVVVTRLDSPGNPPLLHLAFSEPVAALLERIGSLPLPPYITHAAGAEDDARYQTVYASRPGAVAAPTAGLHFDQPLLQALQARGIGIAMLTLHVGSGTFLPVRTENIAEHRMHREEFEVPPETARRIEVTRAAGGRVVAVGTTSLRALEASGGHAGRADTDIFITPGYRFTVVDGLVTNFHLPRSTLLMLVCAFAGMATIRRAYAHAVSARYRFFSYGDAMLLWRAPPAQSHAAAGASSP